jgi:hypothetical protein
MILLAYRHAPFVLRQRPDTLRAGTVSEIAERNLLVELCFPLLGQPRQSFMPFGKIENDAHCMRIRREPGRCICCMLVRRIVYD